MLMLEATVTGKTQLEVCREVPLPIGSRVRVQIEEECESDPYAARLNAYYDKATEKMLAEERVAAREWAAADAPFVEKRGRGCQQVPRLKRMARRSKIFSALIHTNQH